MTMTVQQHFSSRRICSTLRIERYLPLFLLLFVSFKYTDTVLVNAAGTARNRRKNGNPQSRSVRVMNKSGVRIDLFWIHPHTRELAPSHTEGDGVMYGGETGISSYIGHEFEIVELPSKKTQKCVQNECRKTFFAVNTNEDQWITIDKAFNVSLEDSTSRATKKAKEVLSTCLNLTDVNELTECLSRKAKIAIDKERNDIDFQATIRKSMGEQLSDYSCGSNTVSDVSSSNSVSPILLRPVKVTTTPSIRNDTYNDELVQTLFESDYTSVTLYENVLSIDECEDLYNSSTPVPTTIKNKVQDLLDHAGIPVTHEKLSPLKSSNYVVKVESGPTTVALKEECELQSDGSCVTPASANDINTPVFVVERINTDDTISARIILTCVKSNKLSVVTSTMALNGTNTTDNDDDELSYTPSGMMYFTKAGVRIVPTDRSALIIKYDEMAPHDETIISREVDPFLDQHIVCPVTQTNMTVITITYNITH